VMVTDGYCVDLDDCHHLAVLPKELDFAL